jgi:hypothetical protein
MFFLLLLYGLTAQERPERIFAKLPGNGRGNVIDQALRREEADVLPRTPHTGTGQAFWGKPIKRIEMSLPGPWKSERFLGSFCVQLNRALVGLQISGEYID